MLSDIVDNNRTDKNTVHSYLDLYETLLVKKKETATNVLEIGIGDGNQGISNGGSIKLWHDYFTNADVYGVDVRPIYAVWDGLKNSSRIKLCTSINAYDRNFTNTLLQNNTRFDMVLDDGPHSLDSMKACIHLYLPLLKEDGILIIEDVQDFNWFEILKNEVPESFRQYVKIYDLRHIKGRYDDLVFTVDKSNK
jgi:hypothetical protein